MRLLAFVISLTWVALGACGGDSPRTTAIRVAPEPLRLPAGDYVSAAWVKSGWIVVMRRPAGELSVVHDEIMKVRPDGSGLARLDVAPPGDVTCPQAWYATPIALWDGRVALERNCRNAGVDASEFIGVEVETAKADVLTPRMNQGAGDHTWNPSATGGIVANSSGLCASLGRVDRRGRHPLPVTVSAEGQRWRIDRQPPPSAVSCDDTGLADHPSWSADGRRVAFVAAPQALKVSGDKRFDAGYKLWTMTAEGKDARRLLSGIVEPTDVAWAPDGTEIAFSARRGKFKGVWTLPVGSKAPIRISSEPSARLSWSASGDALLATTGDDDTIALAIYRLWRS